jgi:hypothetical protein
MPAYRAGAVMFLDRLVMQRNEYPQLPGIFAANWLAISVVVCLACGAVVASPPTDSRSEADSFAGEIIDTRMEILWASEMPRRWAGSITWEPKDNLPNQAQFTSPVLIYPTPVLSGGVFQTEEGGVVFGPPARLKMVPAGEGKLDSVLTRTGGLSLRVRGHFDDTAKVTIEGDDIPTGFSISFKIADLVRGPAINVMANERASITIRRVAAGDLRVRLGNSATLFWREQTVDVTLDNPMAVPTKPGHNLILDCFTYAAKDDRLVSNVTIPVVRDADGLHCLQGKWVSPSENGAYRVRFRLRDTADDRRWLPTSVMPTNVASSITRTLSGSLPQSLTTPLGLPLSPFNGFSSGNTSQTPRSKEANSGPAPFLVGFPLVNTEWPFSQESAAIAESVVSIAVMASPGDIPLVDPTIVQQDSLESDADIHASKSWIALGSAVIEQESSTVSRFFIQPTAQWFSGAANHARHPNSGSLSSQRLNVMDVGQQLELSVPVGNVGARHRAVIRIPRDDACRLIAELVDLDPTSGVARPLGPGLVIIRNGQPSTFSGTGSDTNDMAGATRNSTRQASEIERWSEQSDAWHEVSIDFWPQSTSTRLVLSNRSALSPATIGRVDVWFNESRTMPYPPVKADLRSAGVARIAAMRLEITDLIEQFSDHGLPSASRPLDYQQVWVATNRLIETMHREGYGGLILTVSSDAVSLFPDRSIVPSAAWNANWASDAGAVDPLRLILRMFERESLQLIPCIRPSSPVLGLERKMLTEGSSSAIATRGPLTGQLGAWTFDSPSLTAFPLYNSVNGDVLAQVSGALLDLNERCRDRACVPAIGILADERSYLRPSPTLVLDDQTLKDFRDSLGDDAPQTEGFESWVQSAGADRFAAWQTERLAAAFQEVLEKLDGRNLLLLSCDSALPPSLVELGRDHRIIPTRLQRRSLAEPLAMRVRDEACNTSVPVSTLPGAAPLAYLAAAFHQPISDVAALEPGPLAKNNIAIAGDAALPMFQGGDSGSISRWPGVTPMMDATESSLALANLINRSDRMFAVIGGGAMNQPASDIRRRSLRVFAELPPVLMRDVESSDTASAALRVRTTNHQGETYIYAVNQTRWPVVWEVTLSRPATIVRLGPSAPERGFYLDPLTHPNPMPDGSAGASANNAPLAPRGLNDGANRWQTIVDGGELVAIRVSSQAVQLRDWRATFAGSPGHIANIRGSVDHAVSRIAERDHLRRIELISNPSFEMPGSDVPGWMLAQYPNDCVSIDADIASHGTRSIRLTNQPGRAGGSWIVSHTLVPPRSGRLAVSARFRGGKPKGLTDASTPPEPLVVRMALEATVAGAPIRKSKSITLPTDQRWGEPQWLEIARLPNLPVESLRLTIDLMSAGEVWVDDIVCYDQFMTAAEQTQWEHLVFLAAGGLSRGDFVNASRLFDSHWGLDLLPSYSADSVAAQPSVPVRRAAFSPSVVGENVNSTAAEVVPHATKSQPKSSREHNSGGWADRLKSWLPRTLRPGA